MTYHDEAKLVVDLRLWANETELEGGRFTANALREAANCIEEQVERNRQLERLSLLLGGEIKRTAPFLWTHGQESSFRLEDDLLEIWQRLKSTQDIP